MIAFPTRRYIETIEELDEYWLTVALEGIDDGVVGHAYACIPGPDNLQVGKQTGIPT